MISIHEFKTLTLEEQVDQLNLYAVSLDIYNIRKGSEVVLFALNDFYVELYVEPLSDEIRKITCFKSTRKLQSYLHQVDIEEITDLLKFSDN